MDRDRRGGAQKTLDANKDRHKDVQEMERQLIVVSQMFQDLDAIVIQQEAAVENIDHRGEDVVENVEQANVQLTGAITSANAARRKKFWCLGIARKSCYTSQKTISSLSQSLSSSSLSLSLWLLSWCYE